MATTPDVRVRLSAEGVQDVVDAFRTIAQDRKAQAKKRAVGLAGSGSV